MSKSLSTLIVIILPKPSLIESNAGKAKDKKKMQPIKVKIMNLMGPLKSLGPPGKYPLFPPFSVGLLVPGAQVMQGPWIGFL